MSYRFVPGRIGQEAILRKRLDPARECNRREAFASHRHRRR
ncbi:hypothetical protein [Rhodovulum sulfidophilum]|nr:hypothetical protein [Rhodovulum sulfidophilum]